MNKEEKVIEIRNRKYYSQYYVNQLQQENKQLKERIEYLERSNNRREDTIIEQRKEISDLEDAGKIEKLETQQKEFIKYMNDIIKELESEDVDDEELRGYIIQRIGAFKEILSKYNEIIGGNYDNNTTL